MVTRRTEYLTIGEVSRITGVKVSTLRAWSDQYGLLSPVRSDGRYRLFTAADVERIVALRQAILVEGVPPALVREKGHLSFVNDSDCVPSSVVTPLRRGATTPAVPQPQRYQDARQQSEPDGRHVRVLHQMAAALSRASDLDSAVDHVLVQACHLLDSDSAALLLMPAPTGSGETEPLKFSIGAIPARVTALDRSILARLASESGLLCVPNIAEWGCDSDIAADAPRSLVAIPLRSGRRVMGACYVLEPSPRDRSSGETALASTFGHLAASCLGNATLTSENDWLAHSYHCLVESDEALLLVVDAQGVVTHATRRASAVLGFQSRELCGKSLESLLAQTSRGRAWNGVNGPGETSEEAQEVDLLRKDGKPVVVEIKAVAGSADSWLAGGERGRRAMRHVPLRLPKVSAGLPEPIGYIVRDRSAIRHVRTEAARRDHQLTILTALVTALSRSLDLDEVLQIAATTVAKTTGQGHVLITLIDEQSQRLVVRSHWNVPSALMEELKDIRLGEGITGRVALTGEPMLIRDIANDTRSTSVVPYAKHHKNRSFACVPLQYTNKVIGTLTVVSKRYYVFTDDDVQFFVSIGQLVASAIKLASAHEETVQGYYDRLVLVRDELRLAAHARNHERQRIASELRYYVLDPLEEGKSSPRAQIRAKSALEALQKEVAGFSDRLSLPALLDPALRWRSIYDPAGRVLRLAWDSWPDTIPSEVTFQLYVLVVRLLLRAREAAPKAGLVVHLVHDDEHVGFQVHVQPRASRPGESARDALSWERVDLSEVNRIVMTLGGKLRQEPNERESILTIMVPRYWEQTARRKPITALIVNDQPLYGQAMANLLDAQEAIEVVGVAQSQQEAVQLVRRLSPDLVVIDVSPPAMKGIDITRAIRAAFPAARILILTPDQGQSVVEGMLAGATGFISKASVPLDLLRAINSTLQADPTLTPEVAGRALALLGPTKGVWNPGPASQRLTPREIDILKLIAAGKSSKQVCQLLRIKDKTVRMHISNMYQKLQIFDRAQLVLYAARNGLVDIEGGSSENASLLTPEDEG